MGKIQSYKMFICFTANIFEEIRKKKYDLTKIESLVNEEVKRYVETMKTKEKYFFCIFYEEKSILSGWAVKKYNKVIITITKTHPPMNFNVEVTYGES